MTTLNFTSSLVTYILSVKMPYVLMYARIRTYVYEITFGSQYTADRPRSLISDYQVNGQVPICNKNEARNECCYTAHDDRV